MRLSILVNNTVWRRLRLSRSIIQIHILVGIPVINVGHCISVTSEKIKISYILPKNRFLGLHCYSRQIANILDAIGPQISRFLMKNHVQGHSMVTNFGTNGKPICDFLCVNNRKLPPILQRFQYMAYNFPILALDRGVLLFNAL